MKIGVLSYSSLATLEWFPVAQEILDKLEKAVKNLGHEFVVYNAEKLQLYFHRKRGEVLYNNHVIKPCDVLLSRVGIYDSLDMELCLLKQFELIGVPVLNKYLPVLQSKNKLRTLQILTNHGLPMPKSVVVRKIEYLDEAVELVNGYPVILKTPLGSWGKGVVLLESRRSLLSALDVLWRDARLDIFLIQEYIAEAKGADYRAFVIGNKVMASMKRQAKKGEFRSNLHSGGKGECANLTDEEKKLAVKASNALGLQISGVDIVRSKRGPLILEVNSDPGLGISDVCNIDVALEIAKFAVKYIHKNSI